MKITVGTADLRHALRAVAPHADPVKDAPLMHRVRLDVGAENLHVSATQRFTVGHAIVSIWSTDSELGPVDISPRDVKEILALFPVKPSKDEQPDDVLEIEVLEKHLTVTDVSGMLPGKALTLPSYPLDDNFPDLLTLIGAKLKAKRAPTERLISSGQLLSLFSAAAAAYKEPLILDATGDAGSILISCGDSFVGLLAPQRPDDEVLAKINGWHLDWLLRLRDYNPDIGS